MNGEHLISSTRQYHNLSNFVINEIGNPNMKNIDDVSEFDEEGNGAKRLDHEEVLDRSIIMDEEELEKEYITDRRDG